MTGTSPLCDKMATTGPYRSPGVDLTVLKETISSDINEFIAGSELGLNRLIEMNLALFERVKALENDLERVCSLLQARNGKIDLLHQELDLLKHENDMLVLKIASVDDSTRATNLRVEGVVESQNENLKKEIAECLSKSGVTCNVGDIDFARRIGKYKQGQNRPVLVRLQREGLRHAILINKAKISQNSPTSIWVNDDVSDVTRSLRKKVRDVVYLAKQNGISDIKIHSDGVIIDNKKYHHSDLDLLPPNISVSKAKSREEEDDIFFQGEESPFSNFYPAVIHDEEGRVFHNLEQAFQFKKAKRHGMILLANKIARTRNPVVVKRLSKKIQPSKEWREAEEGIMAELLMAKFTQNRELARILACTGEKQLHEATTDRKWAIGCSLSSRALSTEEWRGKDLLGQLLENTREAIRSTLEVSYDPLPDDEGEDSDDYEECESDGESTMELSGRSTLSSLTSSQTSVPVPAIQSSSSSPQSTPPSSSSPAPLLDAPVEQSQVAVSSQSTQPAHSPTLPNGKDQLSAPASNQPIAAQPVTKKQRNPYRNSSDNSTTGSQPLDSSSQQNPASPTRKSRRAKRPDYKDK